MNRTGLDQTSPVRSDELTSSNTSGGQDALVMFVTLSGMAALSLLIQGMLAYMLLPEGRGAYAVCIAFGNLLGLILTPGAQQGAQYLVAARQISVSQGVSAALVISFAGGGLAAALAVPLIYSDVPFFQKATTNTFLLALPLVPLTVLSVALDHQLVAQRRFRRLALFSLLRAAANVLGILVLVSLLGLGVNGAVISFAAGHCVIIAAVLLDLWRHCGLSFEMPGRWNLARILKYGLKYHIARIGGVTETQIGVIALGWLASQDEIGLFAAANMLMLGFLLLSNAVGNALYPRVAAAGVGLERSELVARCMRLVGLATGASLLAPMALSQPLVRLLLSEDFLTAVPLLWIIAPGILALALSGILMTHFKGVNRPEVCSGAVFLGLCVNLGALLLLYPGLGLSAAAWSMTAGMICRCLLLAVVFQRTTGMTWLATWLPQRGDATFLWAAGRSALARGVRR